MPEIYFLGGFQQALDDKFRAAALAQHQQDLWNEQSRFEQGLGLRREQLDYERGQDKAAQVANTSYFQHLNPEPAWQYPNLVEQNPQLQPDPVYQKDLQAFASAPPDTQKQILSFMDAQIRNRERPRGGSSGVTEAQFEEGLRSGLANGSITPEEAAALRVERNIAGRVSAPSARGALGPSREQQMAEKGNVEMAKRAHVAIQGFASRMLSAALYKQNNPAQFTPDEVEQAFAEANAAQNRADQALVSIGQTYGSVPMQQAPPPSPSIPHPESPTNSSNEPVVPSKAKTKTPQEWIMEVRADPAFAGKPAAEVAAEAKRRAGVQ